MEATYATPETPVGEAAVSDAQWPSQCVNAYLCKPHESSSVRHVLHIHCLEFALTILLVRHLVDPLRP